jgi:hypothetical protein
MAELRIFRRFERVAARSRLAADRASQSLGSATGVRQQSRDALAQLATGVPGMYVEVDFPRPQPASSVAVESSNDMVNTKIALEGMGTDGQWSTVSDHPAISAHPIGTSLRMAAMAELKARGIQYVVIHPEILAPMISSVIRLPGG